MVNNEQKYTLSWYPNGGSIEKISTLIEEKNELSQTISNVRMRCNCYFLHNKYYDILIPPSDTIDMISITFLLYSL